MDGFGSKRIVRKLRGLYVSIDNLTMTRVEGEVVDQMKNCSLDPFRVWLTNEGAPAEAEAAED